MAEASTVEERLASVEREIADLKRRLGSEQGRSNWLARVWGSFRDVPEFDEVLRLGREFRESQQAERDS